MAVWVFQQQQGKLLGPEIVHKLLHLRRRHSSFESEKNLLIYIQSLANLIELLCSYSELSNYSQHDRAVDFRPFDTQMR